MHQKKLSKFLKIKQDITPTIDHTNNFLKQIQIAIEKLEKNGYNPDTIFIPRNVGRKLKEEGPTVSILYNLLRIDETELDMIQSWNDFDFTDIIIYDSKQLSVTFKASDLSDRVKINVSGMEEGKEEISFHAAIHLSIKIIQKDGFVHIINNHVSKLNPNQES